MGTTTVTTTTATTATTDNDDHTTTTSTAAGAVFATVDRIQTIRYDTIVQCRFVDCLFHLYLYISIHSYDYSLSFPFGIPPARRLVGLAGGVVHSESIILVTTRNCLE